jgi:xanthine permease XanP
MRKPDSIIHWLDSKPPYHHALFIALQQLAFLGVYMGVIRLFSHEKNLGIHDFYNLMATTLIVSGVGVIVQAFGRFGIGSGYFCPLQVTPVAFSVMTVAISLGGFELAFGMLAVVGLTQICLGEVFKRLESVFTVEVAGVAVTMMGFSLGERGLDLIATHDDGALDQFASLKHAGLLIGLTLAAMIAISVWSTGRLRLFSAFVGLSMGVVLAFSLGDLPLDVAMHKLEDVPLLRIPEVPVFEWKLDVSLIPSFMIVGLALSLHGFGAIAMAQRFNDANWKRPDMLAVCRGVRAEGFTNLLGALMSAMPLTSSGGAVSLAAATGCTSRYIAWWLGGMMICFAFIPKLIAIWFLIPLPVTAAAVVFLSVFTAMAGMQMITSRMLDNRKIIAVGVSIIIGISHEPLKQHYYHMLPHVFHAVILSNVAIATTCATLLSLLFRIGAKTRLRKTFVVDQSSLDDIVDFLEQQGKAWGAHHAVVRRAENATWQAFETLIDHDLVDSEPGVSGTITLETQYDEFSFTVVLRYRGALVPLATRPPTHEQLLEDDSAVMRMAGYLMQKLADSVRVRQESGGMAELSLTFKD